MQQLITSAVTAGSSSSSLLTRLLLFLGENIRIYCHHKQILCNWKLCDCLNPQTPPNLSGLRCYRYALFAGRWNCSIIATLTATNFSRRLTVKCYWLYSRCWRKSGCMGRIQSSCTFDIRGKIYKTIIIKTKLQIYSYRYKHEKDHIFVEQPWLIHTTLLLRLIVFVTWTECQNHQINFN